MVVLVIGDSVWSGVEASKLHLDHTPRWPPEITPNVPVKLHHAHGHYLRRRRENAAFVRDLPVGLTFELGAVARRAMFGIKLGPTLGLGRGAVAPSCPEGDANEAHGKQ